jgi:hypothetical protein
MMTVGGIALLLACSASDGVDSTVSTDNPGDDESSASGSSTASGSSIGSSDEDDAGADASSSADTDTAGSEPLLSVLPPCGVLGVRMEYAVQIVGGTDHYVDEITDVSTAPTGELVSTWTRTNVSGPTIIVDHCFDDRIERVRISSAVLMPPDVFISVPLFEGDTWGYDMNDGSSVTRTALDRESVTVPLGTFEAARVHWVVTRDGQVHIDADAYWVDDVGLVKIEGQFSGSDWLQEMVSFDRP